MEETGMTSIRVDGEDLDVTHYAAMHEKRISWTLRTLKGLGVKSVVEVGSHPWVMTAAITDEPEIDLLATISAEEAVLWPDDIDPADVTHELVTQRRNSAKIKTYSLNIERRRAKIEEMPDGVLACEVIEHLVRSPHTMLLNINDWLSVDGVLVITTPNGSQMMNPFGRQARMPAYRAHCYERHSFVYGLPQLIDLVELCGFLIVDSGYSSPYPCSGMQSVRKVLASLPVRYLSEKFDRMLYVVARKVRNVKSLSRTPAIYVPSGSWEFISDTERLSLTAKEPVRADGA
jgi:hypothetical protein